MSKAAIWIPIGLLAAGAAQAQATGSQWGGEAELGIVSTGGNTQTQTINAKGKAVNERDKWKHELTLEALNSQDSKVTTAERYSASGKSNYKLSLLDYVFGLVAYEDDRFSGYSWRASEVLGYGRHVINNQTLQLDLEAGPGARQSKLDNGTDENEGLIRVFGALGWQLSKSAKFSEELGADFGDKATIAKSVTALKSQVNGNLAMKISHTVRYVSKVPAGIEKMDRETSVALVYSY
jgi:putative salt-induced outer membrane protein